MTNNHQIQRLFLVLYLLFFLPTVFAEDTIEAESWINTTTEQLNQIEQKLKNMALTQGTDDTDVKLLSQIQGRAQKCIDDGKNDLSEAEKNLKLLGDPVAGEPADVTKKRQNLKQQINKLKNQTNSCQLLLIQSGDLAQRIKQKISQEVNKKLFNHGSNIIVVSENLLKSLANKPLLNIKALNWRVVFNDNFKIFLIIIGATFFIGVVSRYLAIRRLSSLNTKQNDNFDGFFLALQSCAYNALPLLIPLFFSIVYVNVFLGEADNLFLAHFFNSLVITFGIYVSIRIVLSPCKPAKQYLIASSTMASRLSRYLSTALLLSWLSYLVLLTPLKEIFDTNLFYLIRFILLGSLVIIFSTILWKIRAYSLKILPSWLRLLAILILISAFFAEFLGYRNLSIYLFMGIVGTLLSLAVAVIISRVTSDFFDQLDKGEKLWQIKLRQILNIKNNETIPGLMWLRFLVMLSIWGGFAFTVLRSWGLSQQSELLLIEGISQGFDIGSFHVVPSRIILAILVFSLIVGLSRLFKKKIAEPWIGYTHLDRGARDAVLTIIGYVGFILAILLSLSIAGIEFKNLAVIAGALSVGIGFGLQNIVNNFVSGLILLFERPIRSGDWIEVGETRGYVKSINIRSTLLQTFDRAEVIVPNSELISDQVTNWMLHDTVGRLILKIGVAYGSDVEKVRDILMEIITNHPEVMSKSHYITPPRVLFLEFGDSSLNFEMRFFLKDIRQRRTVTSEINFAIDKAFREAGIEIPFPQRDVHLINTKT